MAHTNQVRDLCWLVCMTAALAESGQNPAREETQESGGNKYSEMFKLKSLHLMAVFILIYIGVEVTLGGEVYDGMTQAWRAAPNTHQSRDLRRLDCYVRYRPPRWWSFGRVHLLWFLRRYVMFTRVGISAVRI